MGITPKFSRDNIQKRCKAFLDEVEAMQIETLKELGEKCVKHARTLPSSIGFNDRTGNLRSSIGYIVFKNGVAIHSQYDKAEGTNANGEPLDGLNGIVAGEALADEIGAENQKGIVLVVTAGMNYASALEANGAYKLKSKRSYIVLSSAQDLAEERLPKMLEELIPNINKATK